MAMRPTREAIRTNRYAYFVSTQTAERKPFFRHQRWVQMMIATLYHYVETGYTLHAFVVMPDHVHVLITPKDTVEEAVQLIKGGFSFRARKELKWSGDIWQQGFTDHRIRDEEDWAHHLEYIRLNPVLANLADEAAAYPFMAFRNETFPQGLRPETIADSDVRAEARTLQSRPGPEPDQGSGLSRMKGTAIKPMKGTGFSPSIEETPNDFGALAPEGEQR
jgi:putative transposase